MADSSSRFGFDAFAETEHDQGILSQIGLG